MHCLFKGTLSALYKDVNVVHPFLLSCGEPLENQQVRELLKRLGVHELEPQELLEQHIYPSIRSNKWKVPYSLYWIAKMILNLFWIKYVMLKTKRCPWFCLAWMTLSPSLILQWFCHQSKPEPVVVSYLVFIKLHSSSQEYSNVAVPVLTCRGLLCPANERVHFSVEYGNIDLPKRLPGREKPTYGSTGTITQTHTRWLQALSPPLSLTSPLT